MFFTVVEPSIISEETLPTTVQTQDQLEVPMLSSCVNRPMNDVIVHHSDQQGDEQHTEKCVREQSEEQSIGHVCVEHFQQFLPWSIRCYNPLSS